MVARMDAAAYEQLDGDARAAHDAAVRDQQAKEQASLPYTWRQTLDAVDLTIALPRGTRGRDVDVVIAPQRLRVALRNTTQLNAWETAAAPRPLFLGRTANRDKAVCVDDSLYAPIDVDASTWSVADGRELLVHLDKRNKQQWWPHVVTSDPEIDTSQIQPESAQLADLDGDTRSMVEKMMFDQRQRAVGKPTSDELRREEALRRFKQAHPEMDFSNAKIM